MLSLYTYTFLAPAGEIVNYLLKMLCTNIWNLLTNVFFQFFRSMVTAVKFVLQTTPEEKIRRIKIGWTCWPNITADICPRRYRAKPA
jgi:hypothetical protein